MLTVDAETGVRGFIITMTISAPYSIKHQSK
jgi:hypothetical protein